MEIEYKNKNYKRKSIYQVGNVIMHVGQPYLVTRIFFNDGHEKYFFVNLKNGNLHTEPCDSLEELERYFGSDDDRLVKAKLIVDYKLDGDTEDEDAK